VIFGIFKVIEKEKSTEQINSKKRKLLNKKKAPEINQKPLI